MIEYVAGFCFDPKGELVVLIEKTKPAWQKGKLNGVGGKLEPDETLQQAMQREFREETGVTVTDWKQFTTLSGDGFNVHFFYAFVGRDILFMVESTTEEVVALYMVDALKNVNTIPNLQWLIPMALSMKHESVSGFIVQELKTKAV
jgi:8-oxo-dGTP diphosphatase